jgi:ABC-2 type transport system permease protein
MLTAQLGHQLRLTVRSPRAVISAAAMPIVLLVLLSALADADGEAGAIQRHTPAMITLGVLGVCFTNVVAGLVASRDAGVLKRLVATPLPVVVHLAGRVLAATLLTCVLTVVLGAVAVVAYGARLEPDGLLPALLGLLVGSVAVGLVGLAVAQAVPHGNAAAGVQFLIMMPVVLVSGVFFPVADLPGWVGTLAEVLPVSHLGALVGAAFGGTWQAVDLLWLAGWGAAGLAFTAWRYQPEPAVRRRRRRSSAAVPEPAGHG